ATVVEIASGICCQRIWQVWRPLSSFNPISAHNLLDEMLQLNSALINAFMTELEPDSPVIQVRAGSGSISSGAADKIQLARSEIWNARECLNLYPNSANVKAEADIIDALTVKLPNLGVNILPMQFRQIKDPMEIVKMAITSPTGAYFHVDELIEVARLLGLRSANEIAAVEEAIAREAAVSDSPYKME
ncbi:hypothetical protein S245_060310, partial [Arachis hypogaea]